MSNGSPSEARPAARGALPPLAWLLRASAIVIAVLGVVDPALTRARVQRPVVALVSADSVRHGRVLTQAAEALAKDARVVRGAVDAADVMVVVGDALPSAARALSASTGGVVLSARPLGAPRIQRAALPSTVTPFATAQVAADITLGTQRATLALLHDGVVVASDSLAASRTPSTQRTERVGLPWTPTSVGVQRVTLRVLTRSSARTPAETLLVDLAAQVDTSRIEVLAWDARPSWLATFVRRAVARDARFVVRSRVVTSRDVARTTRGAPNALSTVTPRVDVVLVGAPDALSSRDAAELRRLVTTEGVALVVLPDVPTPTALDVMLGFGGWRVMPRRTAAVVRGTDALRAFTGASSTSAATTWRGVAIGTPRQLPPSATVLARLDDATNAPALWRAPVGRGEVLVSGAFDAWRTRDAEQSTFTTDWPALVASLAARRLRALDAQPSAIVARPGDPVIVDVIAPANSADALTGRIVAPRGATSTTHEQAQAVVATPLSEPGRWRMRLRAPRDTGAWQLLLTHASDSLRVPLVVGHVRQDLDDAPQLLGAWASAHHGSVIAADNPRALTQAVRDAQQAVAHARPWHPMRSPWWIVPFALALAGEWWLRRRRGWP